MLSAAFTSFGCGMGNNLRFLHSLFPTARYLGSDISGVAIAKLRAAGFARSHFWVNDERLQIPEPISIVIEGGALQHVSKEQARAYVSEIFEAMRPGAEGFFEIASTEHALFQRVGEGGHDAGHGLRYFYTLNDIEELFSLFEITRIYHLKREIVATADDNLGEPKAVTKLRFERADLSGTPVALPFEQQKHP